MSIGAVGSAASPYIPTQSQDKVAQQDPKKGPEQPPEQRSGEELTTVTTKCKENHWHDQSCPHTVSTRPAPETGMPGSLIDVWA